jgi:predicted tellurium resistance membrane protein TerC
MIGLTLIAEGLEVHVPKGYVYFAMFFSFLVNVIQLKTTPKSKESTVKE